MNEVRRRRLWFVGILIVAAGAATALALTALKGNINHYYGPSEVLAGQVKEGQSFRLGGLVLEGSTQRDSSSLAVRFQVTDRFKNLDVEYQGILPDLFKEGQSVIATGQMQGDRFVASEVLAKHDENYMPTEVSEAIERAKNARDAAQASSPTRAQDSAATQNADQTESGSARP
jgi:cytochrome c-type biogenesis protein CcmE